MFSNVQYVLVLVLVMDLVVGRAVIHETIVFSFNLKNPDSKSNPTRPLHDLVALAEERGPKLEGEVLKVVQVHNCFHLRSVKTPDASYILSAMECRNKRSVLTKELAITNRTCCRGSKFHIATSSLGSSCSTRPSNKISLHLA